MVATKLSVEAFPFACTDSCVIFYNFFLLMTFYRLIDTADGSSPMLKILFRILFYNFVSILLKNIFLFNAIFINL